MQHPLKRLFRSLSHFLLTAALCTLYLLTQDTSAALCPTTTELQVISLINAERQKNGLSPLTFDTRLVEAARLHSQDMATRNYFSHDSLDGSDFVDRIRRAGYVNYYTAAENIAAGYATADAVVNAWMNSTGHRANILNKSMKEIGLGYAYGANSDYRHYWTTDFGASTDGPLQGCAPQQRTLSVITHGEGTVVPSNGTLSWSGGTGTAVYPQGSVVTLTAHVDAGSVFAGWSGACAGNGTCAVTMNADTTVTASFVPAQGIPNLTVKYYNDVLGRSPDPGGAESWESEILRVMSLGIDIREGFQGLARFFFDCEEYSLRNSTNKQFVTDLYETFFSRPPDAAGESLWLGQLGAGLTRTMLITNFANSDEFTSFLQNTLGTVTTRPENNLVNDFYRGFLNRFPDSAGFQHWLAQMRAAQCSGATAVRNVSKQIATAFFQSGEYTARARNDEGFIEDLYNGILRRGADAPGFFHWINLLSAGRTRIQVLNDFIASPEFSSRVESVVAAGCLH